MILLNVDLQWFLFFKHLKMGYNEGCLESDYHDYGVDAQYT